MKQHVRKRNAIHLALRLHYIPNHNRFIAVEVVFFKMIRTTSFGNDFSVDSYLRF
jgi:hypothetical protein